MLYYLSAVARAILIKPIRRQKFIIVGQLNERKLLKKRTQLTQLFIIHFSLGSLLKVLKRLRVVRMASQMRVMWQATFMHVVFCKGKVQKPMREYIIQGLLILSPNLSYCSCQWCIQLSNSQGMTLWIGGRSSHHIIFIVSTYTSQSDRTLGRLRSKTIKM